MTQDNPAIKPRYALRAGAASIITVAILIAIKGAAWSQSGAVSVLASLMDSLVDAAASLVSFSAIHYSLRPADREHRYGHGKAEALAALFQAAFIAGAGVFLLFESVARFSSPEPVRDPAGVIVIMAISATLSLLLVGIQKYSLRKAPSLAVEADQAHYAMDVAINIGVIIVMAALHYGAPAWTDPVFALAVALYLAVTVRRIAGKAIDMLLDRELPGDAREVITKKVMSCRGVLGMHDLRTSRSGMRAFISFDIEVDRDLSLHDAHEIARAVERVVLKEFSHAEVMIHVDPHGDTEDSRHQVAGVHDR